MTHIQSLKALAHLKQSFLPFPLSSKVLEIQFVKILKR